MLCAIPQELHSTLLLQVPHWVLRCVCTAYRDIVDTYMRLIASRQGVIDRLRDKSKRTFHATRHARTWSNGTVISDSTFASTCCSNAIIVHTVCHGKQYKVITQDVHRIPPSDSDVRMIDFISLAEVAIHSIPMSLDTALFRRILLSYLVYRAHIEDTDMYPHEIRFLATMNLMACGVLEDNALESISVYSADDFKDVLRTNEVLQSTVLSEIEGYVDGLVL